MAAKRASTGKMTKKQSAQLNRAAAELIRMAEDGGVERNFFFTTTFNRYKFQLETLSRLQAEIDKGDVLVTKEYVKGRSNPVANPAITEYNKTSTAANQTVQTLIKIIQTFAEGPVMNCAGSGDEEIDL